MELAEEYTARVVYFCREGYWRAMQNIASEAMEKFPHDISFKFLHTLSLLFQKQTSEALRILSALVQQHTISLGAIVASISAHHDFTNVDDEEVELLETKLKGARKTAKPDDLYFAGLFLSLSGRHEKSKEYLDRGIRHSNQQHLDTLSLRGWVEISSPTKNNDSKEKSKSPADYFDIVLAINRKHMDARMGLARQYEASREFTKATEEHNAMLSFVPNWIPSLIEKMKLSVVMQDWDQGMEIVSRILSLEPNNLEAFRLKILYSLCREGDMKETNKLLDLFFIICKKQEPRNAPYFNENGKLFSQLGSFSTEILEKSLEFAQYASEMTIENEEYVADIGRIYLLLKQYKEAHDHFIKASRINNASLSALYGLIACQLVEGEIDLAAQQLSFLRAQSSSSIVPSPELYYLDAVLAIKENRSPETILTNLNESVDKHIQEIRKYPLNIQFLKVVNPEFVIKIVREYLVFAPQEPIIKGMEPPRAVLQASFLLEILMKICPAHQDALYIDAQIKYLSGDFNAASLILNRLLKINSTVTEVHLLQAQVYISQNELEQASQTLEFSLSNNFTVRENPKYHFLLAKVHIFRKEVKEAKQALEISMKLFEDLEKKQSQMSPRGVNSMDSQEAILKFNLADQFAAYIELITVLRIMGLGDEAKSRMDEATSKFKGTHLEGRLSLTTAEDHIDKGEIPLAMEILQKVEPTQHHFVEAKKMLADIYLNYKRDRKAYTTCFGEIVKYYPTPPNLVLLGEAFMHIQEPDKAIEAFEGALTKIPRDPLLTAKLGEALVRTHQFNKAIHFYQDAVKADENFPLRLELANLQYRLGKWDGAEKTIQHALGDLSDSGLTRQIAEVDLLTLLAKVQRGAGSYHQSQQTLIKAKDFQSRVLKRALLEQPSIIEKMKIQYCKICQLVGEIAERPNEIEFAIKSIKEAMELRPDGWEILSTLCKLYMKIGDFSHCQQTCIQLQTLNPESDAAIMLGELCYRRGDYINSVLHYQNHLNKHPVHWESLAWYIEGTRRCGYLSDAEVYIKKAGAQSDSNEPGLGYCQGLYEWYSGNVNSALKMLNIARRDGLFGQRTILLMIEIYLNPSGTVLGGDALEATTAESSLANGSLMDAKDTVSKTVEALLRDLMIKSPEDKFRRQILECYALIITRSKNKVEKAIQELSGLVTTDVGRESVMLVHALATAYMFMKQVPRARNQLKRIVKASWIVDDAEYLERCWLLLADIHIQSSKYDLATDLIKKVLQFNKSCVKANEYLGLIMEKEQAYADAAINYEQAWKLTNTTNPAIGYKLAFNYLKAKRYTDAIDVCHIVIGKNPNYPKIKKDILEKARNSLRI